jgi:hypothetical protein
MWDALPSLSRVGRSHPLRQPICTIETQVLKQLLRSAVASHSQEKEKKGGGRKKGGAEVFFPV